MIDFIRRMIFGNNDDINIQLKRRITAGQDIKQSLVNIDDYNLLRHLLLFAISSSNLSAFYNIINKMEKIKKLTTEEWTDIFSYAAMFSSREIIRFLIDKGADIDIKDPYIMDATPLMKEIISKNYGMIDELIRNGAHVPRTNTSDDELLHFLIKDIGFPTIEEVFNHSEEKKYTDAFNALFAKLSSKERQYLLDRIYLNIWYQLKDSRLSQERIYDIVYQCIKPKQRFKIENKKLLRHHIIHSATFLTDMEELMREMTEYSQENEDHELLSLYGSRENSYKINQFQRYKYHPTIRVHDVVTINTVIDGYDRKRHGIISDKTFRNQYIRPFQLMHNILHPRVSLDSVYDRMVKKGLLKLPLVSENDVVRFNDLAFILLNDGEKKTLEDVKEFMDKIVVRDYSVRAIGGGGGAAVKQEKKVAPALYPFLQGMHISENVRKYLQSNMEQIRMILQDGRQQKENKIRQLVENYDRSINLADRIKDKQKIFITNKLSPIIINVIDDILNEWYPSFARLDKDEKMRIKSAVIDKLIQLRPTTKYELQIRLNNDLKKIFWDHVLGLSLLVAPQQKKKVSRASTGKTVIAPPNYKSISPAPPSVQPSLVRTSSSVQLLSSSFHVGLFNIQNPDLKQTQQQRMQYLAYLEEMIDSNLSRCEIIALQEMPAVMTVCQQTIENIFQRTGDRYRYIIQGNAVSGGGSAKQNLMVCAYDHERFNIMSWPRLKVLTASRADGPDMVVGHEIFDTHNYQLMGLQKNNDAIIVFSNAMGVAFRDIRTGKNWVVINVHFTRNNLRRGIRQIKQIIGHFETMFREIQEPFYTLIMGDFNAILNIVQRIWKKQSLLQIGAMNFGQGEKRTLPSGQEADNIDGIISSTCVNIQKTYEQQGTFLNTDGSDHPLRIYLIDIDDKMAAGVGSKT